MLLNIATDLDIKVFQADTITHLMKNNDTFFVTISRSFVSKVQLQVRTELVAFHQEALNTNIKVFLGQVTCTNMR